MAEDSTAIEPLSGRPCKWKRNSTVLLNTKYSAKKSRMFSIAEPKWFRRHILTYWKSWVVIFTPLLLLPLCIVINTPVGCLISKAQKIQNDNEFNINLLCNLGSQSRLCHSAHVDLLGIDGSSVGRDQSPSDCSVPIDGRYGHK
jgi:hypothetical protein